jgi:hypothetical protein
VGNESNWVRSLYVYGVCLISMLVVLVGAALTASSAVTIISPSTGLTSGWERVLVGGTSVVEEGVKIAEEYMSTQQGDMSLPEFCEGTVAEIDREYCASLAEDIATAGDEPVIPVEVNDAITLVRDEVLHQVRMAAIGRLVIGVVVVALGILVFRRHRGLTALYQSAPKPPPTPAAPVSVPAPVAPTTQPQVPPAPPTWSRSRDDV